MWTKIDDGLFSNRKIQALSDAAVRVWLAGLCYASAHETDGALREPDVRIVLAMAGKGPRVARELVTAGLWEPDGDGYRIHDYLDYNPSHQERQTDRRQTAERVARHRARLTGGDEEPDPRNGVTNGDTNSVSNGVPVPDPYPTRPVPDPVPVPAPSPTMHVRPQAAGPVVPFRVRQKARYYRSEAARRYVVLTGKVLNQGQDAHLLAAEAWCVERCSHPLGEITRMVEYAAERQDGDRAPIGLVLWAVREHQAGREWDRRKALESSRPSLARSDQGDEIARAAWTLYGEEREPGTRAAGALRMAQIIRDEHPREVDALIANHRAVAASA